MHALRRLPLLRAEATDKNRHALTRQTQLDHEQPACVHANMDLLRYALRLAPFVDASCIGDALDVALQARDLDIRASPYLARWRRAGGGRAPVWKSKFYVAFVLNRRVDLRAHRRHAPARWRGDAGSSITDGSQHGRRLPANDLVNEQQHLDTLIPRGRDHGGASSTSGVSRVHDAAATRQSTAGWRLRLLLLGTQPVPPDSALATSAANSARRSRNRRFAAPWSGHITRDSELHHLRERRLVRAIAQKLQEDRLPRTHESRNDRGSQASCPCSSSRPSTAPLVRKPPTATGSATAGSPF